MGYYKSYSSSHTVRCNEKFRELCFICILPEFMSFSILPLLKLLKKSQVGERTDPHGTLSNEKDLEFSWHFVDTSFGKALNHLSNSLDSWHFSQVEKKVILVLRDLTLQKSCERQERMSAHHHLSSLLRLFPSPLQTLE